MSSYTYPPLALQRGGGAQLATRECGVYNAVPSMAWIYTAHNMSHDWGSGPVSAIRFYQVKANANWFRKSRTAPTNSTTSIRRSPRQQGQYRDGLNKSSAEPSPACSTQEGRPPILPASSSPAFGWLRGSPISKSSSRTPMSDAGATTPVLRWMQTIPSISTASMPAPRLPGPPGRSALLSLNSVPLPTETLPAAANNHFIMMPTNVCYFSARACIGSPEGAY